MILEKAFHHGFTEIRRREEQVKVTSKVERTRIRDLVPGVSLNLRFLAPFLLLALLAG
jgi:hypothetical protein